MKTLKRKNGTFWRKPTSKASFVSMVVSLGVVLLWLLGSGLHWGSLFSVDALWPGLASSGIVFVLFALLDKPTADDLRRAELFCGAPPEKMSKS